MGHYAKVEDGIVTQVIVADGPDWCEQNLGGQWVQTSYNKSFRKNYAAIGMFYDEIRDAFYWQESDVSDFVFDEETCTWIPPIPLPQDNKLYNWDYINSSWVELILE